VLDILLALIYCAYSLIVFIGLMWITLIILAPKIASPHLEPALKSLERLFCSGASKGQAVFRWREIVAQTVAEIAERLPRKR